MENRLFNELKVGKLAALKARDSFRSSLIGVILGQVELLQPEQRTDDDVYGVIKRLVKSNTETISSAHEGYDVSPLKLENEYLETLLPPQLSSIDIRSIIEKNGLDIKGAKSDGQAIGLVMKASKGAANPQMVRQIVEEIRKAE